MEIDQEDSSNVFFGNTIPGLDILNEINLGHVARGSSLNATARCLVRTAYGETASFNDLASGGFDLLL
ncbi:unnamed protein product, partial [Rotaria sp. Silwood1]